MSKLRLSLDVLVDIPDGFELKKDDEGQYFQLSNFPNKRFVCDNLVTIMEEVKDSDGITHAENSEVTELLDANLKAFTTEIEIVDDEYEL
jgi:hypothetical protein